MAKYYLDEVGREISCLAPAGVSLTDASVVLKILALKPNGQKPEWDNTTDGVVADGSSLVCTTVVGDLNCSGVWKLQSYVDNDDGIFYGETETFTVYEKFK